MPSDTLFKDLFVFEMANNHQGSVDHGIAIIRAMGDITRKYNLNAAVKLQFRNLSTFIHPLADNNKHIERFKSTELSEEQFSVLVQETKDQGMHTMSTPFDEDSVDTLMRLGVEIIKVGSPSLNDFPLFSKIAKQHKPVIISSGGISIDQVDKIVNFFEHRNTEIALMHCVSIYPTPNEKLELNTIEHFKCRYPSLTIGFSTHEDPNNTHAISVAYAKGARMFEKHVGVPTDTIKLNLYSANPSQVDAWVNAHEVTKASLGSDTYRVPTQKEGADLRTLYRGVFAKTDIKRGETMTPDKVFFAFPIQPNTINTGQYSPTLIADQDYSQYQGISPVCLREKTEDEKKYEYIHKIKSMLNINSVHLSHEFSVELSHHFGIDQFDRYGCTIITCINNDEYAKKIIIQLPGQINPSHLHRQKDETFCVLHGELIANVGKLTRRLQAGEILRVPRNIYHSFTTDTGVIFEEVSTKSVANDSFYEDEEIAAIERSVRKTQLYNWGIC